MEDNYFDKEIKKSLEDLRADGPGHWDHMESFLNDPANADLVAEGNDQVFRQKLENLEVEMPAGHWGLMEAQLAGLDTEGELENVMLDGKAYESLRNYIPAYNKDHWPIMEEKIQVTMSWRRKAIRFKLVEIAILFLAFFTVLQYWPEAKQIIPSIKKDRLERAQMDIPQPIASIDELSALVKETVNQDQKVVETQNRSTVQTPATIAQASISENSAESGTSEILASSSEVQRSLILTDVDSSNPININSTAELSSEAPLSPIEAKLSNVSRLGMVSNIPFKAYDLLPVEALPFSDKKSSLRRNYYSSIRVGMASIGSVDFVGTANIPGDIALGRVDSEQSTSTDQTLGYGTAINLAYQLGRWEIGSGFGYLSKTVKPSRPNIEIDQVSLNLREAAGTFWSDTRYDMINIPVHVRFNVMDQTKWKAFVQSGLSMTINQNVIYRYDQVYLGPDAQASAAPPGGAENLDADRAQEFDPTNVSTNVGLGSDKLFEDNAYFNLNFGLGFERAISKRYAGFLQANYFHRIDTHGNNIGLENESTLFRSAQIQAGVKISLFKKEK
ncbi:MAG: hypothetical protein HKN16_02250 [Saprospiraceae bacterium]|nr:hypothetical protein [Saprospiraceae bacterium]